MALTGDSVCGICIKANIIKKIKMPCFYNSEDAAVVPLLVYESKVLLICPKHFITILRVVILYQHPLILIFIRAFYKQVIIYARIYPILWYEKRV